MARAHIKYKMKSFIVKHNLELFVVTRILFTEFRRLVKTPPVDYISFGKDHKRKFSNGQDSSKLTFTHSLTETFLNMKTFDTQPYYFDKPIFDNVKSNL